MPEGRSRGNRAGAVILTGIGVALIGAGQFVNWACGMSFATTCGDSILPLTGLGALLIGLAVLYALRTG